MHCSKTPTATGHLPACDVETDDGPWVPHVGYVQTGKRRYPQNGALLTLVESGQSSYPVPDMPVILVVSILVCI